MKVQNPTSVLIMYNDDKVEAKKTKTVRRFKEEIETFTLLANPSNINPYAISLTTKITGNIDKKKKMKIRPTSSYMNCKVNADLPTPPVPTIITCN